MKRQILIATTNRGKLAELSAMLDLDIQWLSLSDLGGLKEVEEDGKTFAENARKKSAGYALQSGLWTIADDSGLVIDALGGAPGVRSARFSEISSDRCSDRALLDRENTAKVLELMKLVPASERTARFICCLCLACPCPAGAKILLETQGTLDGLMAEAPAGENGFGYDPIFFAPSLGKTVAQLGEDEKNSISHRGNAIRKLKPLLEKLLVGGNWFTP